MPLCKGYGMLALPIKKVQGSIGMHLTACYAAADKDVEAAVKAEVASLCLAAHRPLLPAVNEIGVYVGKLVGAGPYLGKLGTRLVHCTDACTYLVT